MINAYWEALRFRIQEGEPRHWLRIVDTDLASPADFSDRGSPLQSPIYEVAPRSVVVLIRTN
jgi:pullulanase/glycogen debranching enzyme